MLSYIVDCINKYNPQLNFNFIILLTSLFYPSIVANTFKP